MLFESRRPSLKQACPTATIGLIKFVSEAFTRDGRITPMTEKHVHDWIVRDQAAHRAAHLMFPDRIKR
ncbi:hypothetical protein A2970_02620 [Candidatus Roizmanbacteria bacterium RIFCSPLOWO2_01_FULL_44_13]|uniref:Uncharacterized protein n=1 Tax=Candidatus Roizmanbacteria bacterium RIFCSPLOWO2_01_FULL_44_13 TaxID=1802069 RepID=A0A1F7J915_9BACT|nr:MAG: hypothetical protein A2970_02620 [Candidatus Roizmanbacteria bacterium RIFCSPLOWO2_01_FULL_44_13]